MINKIVSNGRFSLGGDTPGSGVAGTPVGLTPSDRRDRVWRFSEFWPLPPLAKTALRATPRPEGVGQGVGGSRDPPRGGSRLWGYPPGTPPGDPPLPPLGGGGGPPPF